MRWFPEGLLWAWTGLAVSWRIIADLLVRSASPAVSMPDPSHLPSLTVFKPLPPLAGASVSEELRLSLESFLRQGRQGVEILIGVPEEDMETWAPLLNEWKEKYLSLSLGVLGKCEGNLPNPKIDKLRRLARLAKGELWLWSDADIVAPEGFLDGLRREWLDRGCALTCPYVIRRNVSGAGWLDALFIDLEFFPGALLLARQPAVDFCFGAGTLFAASDFQERADWARLGSTLADDHQLGKEIGPVGISRWIVETWPERRGWRSAFEHFWRWQKTVLWVQPAGYAAQILIWPVLGWAAWALCRPHEPRAWIGWAAAVLAQSVIGALTLRRIGIGGGNLQSVAALPAWFALRPWAWALSWLPAPVRWTGARPRWSGLTQPSAVGDQQSVHGSAAHRTHLSRSGLKADS
ncbi:MAG: glycosyltransferase family 21 [Verrucomicrobiae bacterium]|nr:glycosyltransferase family 21 [Verrucomicrobiae bacterium]